MAISLTRPRGNSLLRPLCHLMVWGSLSQSCSSPEIPPGLHVEFEGQHVFGETDLLLQVTSELHRYKETSNPAALSDAAFRIAHFYELAGYEGTQVLFSNTSDQIRFIINEGAFLALGSVRIVGTHAIPQEELLQAVPENLFGSVPFSEPLVAQITSHIANVFADRGYVEVIVGVPDRILDKGTNHINLIIHVTEGMRYSVKGFQGLPDIDRLRKRVATLIGRPYTPSTAGEVEAAILDDYRQHGYPFVHAAVRPSLDSARGTVEFHIDVVPGSLVRIGNIETRGQFRTRPSYIEARADLEEGKIYDDGDLRLAEKRLLETTLFKTVHLAPGALPPDSDRVPIEITLEERDAGEVSLRLGYGTFDGIRGGTDFRYANLMGGGEIFRVSFTGSRYDDRGDAEFALPFILGSNFRPAISAFYEEEQYPSFNAVSFGGDLSLAYPLLEKLQVALGVRHDIVRTSDVAPGVPPGDLLDFDYTAPFLTALLDLRDNPLLPTKGFLLDTRFEWSDRRFGSEIQYLSANGRAVYLLPLPWYLDLAVSLSGGVIAPIENTESIPIALRYFAGGTNTVRGFKFATVGPQVNGEPTGGEVFLALQAEVRFPIWGALHGALFSDRGDVWTDYRQVNLGDARYSVGTGLRYYTPAGAIVGDFAWNPDRQPGERGWEFHFNIGFPF